MSDSKRLKSVLNYVKKNRNSFAQSIGMERSASIYTIIKGEYGISADLAKSITDHYKEINYEWLLEGTGDCQGYVHASILPHRYQCKGFVLL